MYISYFSNFFGTQQYLEGQAVCARPAMEEYSEEMRRFTQRLSRLLSENLNLPPELMEEVYGSFPSQVVRLNYYPPCPQPELVMGLSSHSDPGAITILLQVSDVCGLQVRKDGEWVSVHPEPNALIINMGDQMEVPKIMISPLKLYRSEHCTMLQIKLLNPTFSNISVRQASLVMNLKLISPLCILSY